MTEDFAACFQRHEDMIQALARVWTRQGEINEGQQATTQRIETFNEEQRIFNAELW